VQVVDVRPMRWFEQWRHTCFANVGQCFQWGADEVHLVGVKGGTDNLFAGQEWPSLMEDMFEAFSTNMPPLDKGDYQSVTERRVEIAQLPHMLAAFASGNSFMMIVSCPNQHFDEVKRIVGANRNIIIGYSEVGDYAGGMPRDPPKKTEAKFENPTKQLAGKEDQFASELTAALSKLAPERPRPNARPAFFWCPSSVYAREFQVSGENGEVVTKLKNFDDQGWLVPVGGAWCLMRGGIYRWTVKIERKCPSKPQMQLGIQGINHSQLWRLVTTSRCSRSRDGEPWQDRPGGDRFIDEGDYLHFEVDLRGIHCEFGIFALAINNEPYEMVFADIPLDGWHGCDKYPLVPVVSMGGEESQVRVCPSN